MSMSLQDQYAEAASPALQGRVQMAVSKTAQNVGTEDSSTPNDSMRKQLATNVARAPQQYAQPFTTIIVAQGVTGASTDADIENMVSACWNTMAGIPYVPPAAP